VKSSVFVTMATCFGADYDFDASSSDISAPPTSRALGSRVRVFTPISGERLEGHIG
jgi:hypothetical protein